MKEKVRLAAALSFDAKKDHAPRVTASGEGQLASAIMKTASLHNIPVKKDPVLASMLLSVPRGSEIPENLYKIVAAIFATIYR